MNKNYMPRIVVIGGGATGCGVARDLSLRGYKVVLIEYPRKGIWTLALVTGESCNKEGINFYHLFLPTSPNPTSGYMLYISKDDVIEIDMKAEEAIKIIVSGGSISPKLFANLICCSLVIS